MRVIPKVSLIICINLFITIHTNTLIPKILTAPPHTHKPPSLFYETTCNQNVFFSSIALTPQPHARTQQNHMRACSGELLHTVKKALAHTRTLAQYTFSFSLKRIAEKNSHHTHTHNFHKFLSNQQQHHQPV